MKVIRLLSLSLLFVALAVAVVSPGLHVPPPTVNAAASNDSDRVLVKFKDGVPASDKAAVHRQIGGRPIDTIRQIEVDIVELPQGKGEGAVAAYQRNPRVQFAEPDALVAPEAVPDDPYYTSARHLPVIEAPGAWDLAKATGVLIAICDTGFLGTHPDLATVLRGDLGYNTADGSNDWSPIASHGTSVAGVAAAATNNGTGVSGVAWGAKIIPVRITNRTDGAASVSDAAECITYAADKGARAINLSYRMAGSSTIDSAGKYAQGKGAVTTVAAGNQGEDPGWPNYAGFLAVTATNSIDAIASWSNYGTFVDIAAPGVSLWTTRSDGTYWQISGTSISSPVVAGVVALIFGANPGLSASQAQDILLSTTDDVGNPGWDPYFGHGRVNAREAVAAVLGSTPTPSTGAISGTATDTADGAPISGATVSDGVRTASTNASGVYNLTGVPAGTYTVTASAAGYKSASQTVSVLAGNTATANFALAPSTGAISGTVTDAAGDTPISGATVSDGVRTASTNASGVYSLTGVPAGTYTVTASAAGYYSAGQTVAVTAGNTTTANFTLTGQPPAPTPVVTVTNITPDTMKRGTSMAVTITGSGFAAGAGVRFENGDGPAPTASNVVVVDSLTIKATVTAKNGGPSRNSHWVVKVTNPDGSAGSLNGLTVVP